MLEAHTLSVSIDQPVAEVYAYLSDPARIPEWSQFILAIRPEGEQWLARTPEGEVRMTFTAPNPFGVLDHEVTKEGSTTVHVPLRVIKNGEGTEVLFTVFRRPGMTTSALEEDLAFVQRDLKNLRKVMEASSAGAAAR